MTRSSLPSFRPSFAIALLCISAALGTGCSADTGDEEVGTDSSSAIVGGEVAKGDSAVVLLRDATDESWACSGTLIAPGVVLTAAHCASNDTAILCRHPYDTDQRSFEHKPKNLRVRIPTATTTHLARAKAWIVPTRTPFCGDDIALLVLDKAVTGVKPMAVELDAPVKKGEAIRFVGFGIDESNRGGSRRELDGIRVLDVGTSVSRDEFMGLSTKQTEFEIPTGPCFGDSGGPAISSRTNKVIGVLSHPTGGTTALADCSIYDNVLTSTAAWSDFIREGIAIADGALP